MPALKPYYTLEKSKMLNILENLYRFIENRTNVCYNNYIATFVRVCGGFILKEELKEELHKIIDGIDNTNVLAYLIDFIKKLSKKVGN